MRLIADELDLGIRRCECIVIDEVVCLLIDGFGIARPVALDVVLYCFGRNVTMHL